MEIMEKNLLLSELFSTIYKRTDEESRKLIDVYYKGNMTLETSVVGSTFTTDGQSLMRYLSTREDIIEKTIIFLEREPKNKFDRNAIKVIVGTNYSANRYHVGYISKELAKILSALLDRGFNIKANLNKITGGNGMNFGMILNYKIE